MAKKAKVNNDFKITNAIVVDGRKIEKVLKEGSKVTAKEKGPRYKNASKEKKAMIDAIYADTATIYKPKVGKTMPELKYNSLASIKDDELSAKVINAIVTIVKSYK
jgi:hypothetical protein